MQACACAPPPGNPATLRRARAAACVPPSAAHAQLTLGALAPWGVVVALALALVESYRLAALWGEPDFEKRTYPGRPFDFLGLAARRWPAGGRGPAGEQPADDEAPPGLGVYASWLGGLPGWLAGGWWFERREMTEAELVAMKGRELRNGRLAM